MISIEYNRNKHSLSAKGHACYAEAGHDIVCSAVSALLFALAYRLEALHDMDPRAYHQPDIKMERGDAEIAAHCGIFGSLRTTEAFDTITCGLRMIAKDYPDNACYREI